MILNSNYLNICSNSGSHNIGFGKVLNMQDGIITANGLNQVRQVELILKELRGNSFFCFGINEESLNNRRNVSAESHPFHLVDNSPWPFLTSIAIFHCAMGLINWFHYGGCWYLIVSLITLLFFLSRWFTDITVEATFEGNHTRAVQQGIKQGMVLFILSEAMFFFSFFWAFFHYSLSPSTVGCCVWPPIVMHSEGWTQIMVLHVSSWPLLNTILLLSSGWTVSLTQHAIIFGDRRGAIEQLALTILFGVIFLLVQTYEYCTCPFSINDMVFGSIFYFLTGFHGLHVLMGTIFLCVCFLRLVNYHFTREQHVGFECCAWYWHFVDVVWLFLYIWLYFWGS